MEALLVVILVPFVLLFACWYHEKAHSILETYLREKHYQLISKDLRLLCKGPFQWSKNQAVFYVVINDQNGVKRSGFICIGNFWSGLISKNIESRWEQ